MKNIVFIMPDGSKINLTKRLKPKNKFVAQSPGLGGLFGLKNIEISPLFDHFNYGEKVAIIHHELWHRKNNELVELKMYLKKPWCIFYRKPVYHHQEFQADLNGANFGGKKHMLSVLRKLKKMIENGSIPSSHKKTHPPIDERIRKIKNL